MGERHDDRQVFVGQPEERSVRGRVHDRKPDLPARRNRLLRRYVQSDYPYTPESGGGWWTDRAKRWEGMKRWSGARVLFVRFYG